jgi:cholesterol oxidase
VRYDVVVIGSGFGGSVAALRAAEKGYSVAVLEAGRRFADADLPRTSWRLRRFLWAPRLGCLGIQRLALLPGRRGAGVLVLGGAGVGGGSLVYANTLYEPGPEYYADPQWDGITDWRAELAPAFDLARRMLGVTTYPARTAADEAMRAVAGAMGVAGTFRPTPVAVHLGEPGREVPDPYFGGAGPPRAGCRHCGACLTGCRYNAKNTLVKNYLWLAERAGVAIHERTTVTAVHPEPGGGYRVETVRTGAWPPRRGAAAFHADQVVFAAGPLGTPRLLHRMKATGALPGLSARLGTLTRTNSEAILGASVPARAARRRGVDFTGGVAITSSFHPDARTHIEPVRYGPGSNAMGLLQSLLVPGGPWRPLRWLGAVAAHPVTAARTLWVRRWSQRTVIALVMQSHDNSLTVRYRRAWYGRRRLVATPGSAVHAPAAGLASSLLARGSAGNAPAAGLASSLLARGTGEPNPTWIPAGHRAARLLAERIGGVPGGAITEAFNVPMTAHLLGGAVIGASPAEGVVDPYHRVFGHPGLHVLDATAIPANLGVNPALTITAQAERAMSLWPNRGEPDPRPAPGDAYRRLDPVRPRRPAVPPGAPAALDLPTAPSG